MCYISDGMKRNKLQYYKPTILEYARRLGIIMMTISFVNGVLEDGNLWVAFFLAAVGICVLMIGNLRYANE